MKLSLPCSIVKIIQNQAASHPFSFYTKSKIEKHMKFLNKKIYDLKRSSMYLHLDKLMKLMPSTKT